MKNEAAKAVSCAHHAEHTPAEGLEPAEVVDMQMSVGVVPVAVACFCYD